MMISAITNVLSRSATFLRKYPITITVETVLFGRCLSLFLLQVLRHVAMINIPIFVHESLFFLPKYIIHHNMFNNKLKHGFKGEVCRRSFAFDAAFHRSLRNRLNWS